MIDLIFFAKWSCERERRKLLENERSQSTMHTRVRWKEQFLSWKRNTNPVHQSILVRNKTHSILMCLAKYYAEICLKFSLKSKSESYQPFAVKNQSTFLHPHNFPFRKNSVSRWSIRLNCWYWNVPNSIETFLIPLRWISVTCWIALEILPLQFHSIDRAYRGWGVGRSHCDLNSPDRWWWQLNCRGISSKPKRCYSWRGGWWQLAQHSKKVWKKAHLWP